MRLVYDGRGPVSVGHLLILAFASTTTERVDRGVSSTMRQTLRTGPFSQRLRGRELLVRSTDVSAVRSFYLGLLGGGVRVASLPTGFSLVSRARGGVVVTRDLSGILRQFCKGVSHSPSVSSLMVNCNKVGGSDALHRAMLTLFGFTHDVTGPSK